jgi:hypothetical protein
MRRRSRRATVETIEIPKEYALFVERRLSGILDAWFRTDRKSLETLALSCYAQGISDIQKIVPQHPIDEESEARA